LMNFYYLVLPIREDRILEAKWVMLVCRNIRIEVRTKNHGFMHWNTTNIENIRLLIGN